MLIIYYFFYIAELNFHFSTLIHLHEQYLNNKDILDDLTTFMSYNYLNINCFFTLFQSDFKVITITNG